MRQSAMYPQEHAPSLRHDQTPAKDSADMVGTGCCVCVVFPQVNEPPQTHRNLRDPRTRVVHANSAVSTRSRLVIKFTQECEALVAGSYEVAEFGNFWSMKKGEEDSFRVFLGSKKVSGFTGNSQENHRK